MKIDLKKLMPEDNWFHSVCIVSSEGKIDEIYLDGNPVAPEKYDDIIIKEDENE